MAETKIEWATHTWNPVSGCTKISTGCKNCYAERMSKRLAGRCGYPADEPFRVTLHPEKLGEPLKWKKPRKIFVNSMSDLFHDQVSDEFIARIWWVMGQCAGYLDPTRYRGHTFLILTKRPERMKEWLGGWRDRETRKGWIESFGEVFDWECGPKYWPDVLPNVWLGISVENQTAADERIPLLLQTPAAVRFISAEPLLGRVDLEHVQFSLYTSMNVLEGCGINRRSVCQGISNVSSNNIDWVICGGESGPGARPMHPDWVRSLRDQCQAAGTRFFFKQWGEWMPAELMNVDTAVKKRYQLTTRPAGSGEICSPWQWYKTGKREAGRLLDGRTWDEMPEVNHG